jgi:hypothetical protein
MRSMDRRDVPENTNEPTARQIVAPGVGWHLGSLPSVLKGLLDTRRLLDASLRGFATARRSLLTEPVLARVSGLERREHLGMVDVRLEADHSPIRESPDVDFRHVELFPGASSSSPCMADLDHLIACLNELLR